MSLTYIDTNKQPVSTEPGAGKVADVINEKLCGAKNVVAKLRWLKERDELKLSSDASTHQLVYLLDGEGVITLEGKEQKVVKGAGIYLGPSESAEIKQSGSGVTKLFHLIVPKNS